ncbi:MAG: hypothetical protein ACXVZO_06895 [Gaiellaceae bacterium]
MRSLMVLVALAVAASLAACGGRGKGGASSTAGTTTAAGTHQQATTKTAQPSPPSALQAEATSAATGDIPDNQVFIGFRDRSAGYSMKYPEGWAQQGTGARVTFRDKNNIVRVIIASSAIPTRAQIQKQLAGLPGTRIQSGPQPLRVGGAPSFKVVYTTQSTPNPVTGKRVVLVVDRYYLSHAGKQAIVDLGTPVGVDNVDAYRLMIESFRWK